QPDTLKAVFFWGHSPTSVPRGSDVKRSLEKLDLIVSVDPYPTAAAVLGDRGSVTALNRSVQWRGQGMAPRLEAKVEPEIMYLLARKLGFDKEMLKNIKVVNNEPVIEDITREYNRGMWTIGYTGQSPERLKLHMANQHTFDKTTLKASGGPCSGDYYGLPWPCWGTPQFKHPGTPILYDTNLPVKEGGGTFGARFGVERVVKRKVIENGREVEREEHD